MNVNRTELIKIKALAEGLAAGENGGASSDFDELFHGINRILFEMDDVREAYSGSAWLEEVRSYLDGQIARDNQQDRWFYGILECAKLMTREEMIRFGKANFRRMDGQTQERYEKFYNSFAQFWGTIDLEADRFEVLERRISVLEERQKELRWLYGRLADCRSKEVLVSTMRNWLNFDVREIDHMRDKIFPQYYDPDILQVGEEDVLVDLGAYTGDSAASFIEMFGKYRKIYCYEITPESTEKMRKSLRQYPDIEIRQKGVGEKKGQMFLSGSEVRSSANALSLEQGTPVEIVSLDEDIPEAVSLIKMDIEGAEQSALKGAAGHIRRERPKLLISVYHGNTDLYEIPELIDSLRGDYRFYLRSYGYLWAPAEIILYAV